MYTHANEILIVVHYVMFRIINISLNKHENELLLLLFLMLYENLYCFKCEAIEFQIF